MGPVQQRWQQLVGGSGGHLGLRRQQQEELKKARAQLFLQPLKMVPTQRYNSHHLLPLLLEVLEEVLRSLLLLQLSCAGVKEQQLLVPICSCSVST